MDCASGRLGLPSWFRRVYFSYHARVKLRFKLAAGLGEPWTWDGRIPQGGPLNMVFTVALYVPWCRYPADQVGFPSSYMLIPCCLEFKRNENNSLAFFYECERRCFGKKSFSQRPYHGGGHDYGGQNANTHRKISELLFCFCNTAIT